MSFDDDCDDQERERDREPYGAVVTQRTLVTAFAIVLFAIMASWMAWVTTSLISTANERTITVGEWSSWRGAVTQKLDRLSQDMSEQQKDLDKLNANQQKLLGYFQQKGWKLSEQ